MNDSTLRLDTAVSRPRFGCAASGEEGLFGEIVWDMRRFRV